MPVLEYAITRPYPWRWTTMSVAFFAAIVFAGLSVFNFAAVGYNRQSSYSDKFTTSSGLEWKHKLNTAYTQSRSMDCDPNTLALGGIYRSNNAIFALNVESLRDPITTAPLGSANYSGDVLDSCRVNRIYMMADFNTHDAKWRAQVACKSRSLFANFTVDSIVTLRAGVTNGIINVDTLGELVNERTLPEAIATSVIYALGMDVLGSIFFSVPTVQSASSTRNGSATSLWAEWDPLATDADLPMVVSGMAASDGSFIQSHDANSFSQLLPPARRSLQNYATALHSAILFDLGSTAALSQGLPDTNVLTNLSALQSRITSDGLLPTYMTQTNGSANGLNFTTPAAPFLLAHVAEFGLPLPARRLNMDGAVGQGGDPGPATLVQRYLCHSMVLKPAATLVVDVIVATISMFMVAWGIAQIGLMYVAKEHTVNGNFCACPTCDSYAHGLVPVTPGEKTVEAVEYAWAGQPGPSLGK